eukprot:8947314-Prorocentrum_lima.AAC.1
MSSQGKHMNGRRFSQFLTQLGSLATVDERNSTVSVKARVMRLTVRSPKLIGSPSKRQKSAFGKVWDGCFCTSLVWPHRPWRVACASSASEAAKVLEGTTEKRLSVD